MRFPLVLPRAFPGSKGGGIFHYHDPRALLHTANHHIGVAFHDQVSSTRSDVAAIALVVFTHSCLYDERQEKVFILELCIT